MFDKILKNPLLTEEGFINPICMNELENVLKNTSKTYSRLSNDSEWNTPKWIFISSIVGAFADSAINVCPIGIPKGLENICNYLYCCLKKSNVDWKTSRFMVELSLCQINKLLYDILYDQGIEEFDNWNKSQAEADGVEKTSDIAFSSRESEPDPYYDFIDLDALLHNTCIIIRNDRREFDRFNKKFEEEYGSLS